MQQQLLTSSGNINISPPQPPHKMKGRKKEKCPAGSNYTCLVVKHDEDDVEEERSKESNDSRDSEDSDESDNQAKAKLVLASKRVPVF
jgi:hypothetical protein